MSAAARSASTCRSTCSCRTSSSRRSVIVAKDLDARQRLQPRLEKLLAEEFPGLVARVSPLELGPPVGWPVQYRVSGPDKDEVTRIAQDLAQVMAAAPGARHVNFDWMEPARQLASASTRTRRGSSA